MKFTALFLLVAAMQVSANGYSQRVTLSEKNVPLEKIFTSIKKQTGYSFLYTREMLEDAKKVSIQVKDASLQEVLDRCLEGQRLSYSINNNTIVIRPASLSSPSKENENAGYTIIPPPIDITGRILNEDGEPVISSIVVKGTQQGTSSNAEGYFELKGIDPNATLILTGTSIEKVEIKVNGRTSLDITVKKKEVSLQEVIINKGYYEEKKSNSVGNVVKISGEELQRQPIANPLLGLQGRVAGVQVNQSSGMPGKAFVVQIRGRNSILNGTIPLYVIDGVPQFNAANSSGLSVIENTFISRTGGIGNSQFFGLNSADIESIEILKDADATAIYGSRGANGVILITTRKGKKSIKETKGSVTMIYGTSRITNAYNLLNTQDYITMRREAYKNDGIVTYPANAYDINGTWDTTRYTDWQNELIDRNAGYFDLQTALTGRSATLSYNLGVGYRRETTTNPGDFFDARKSVHLALSHQPLNQRFSFNLSLLYALNENKLPIQNLGTQSLLLAPNAPALYDKDGALNWENGTWTNPLSNLYRIGKGKNIFSNSILDINYKITSNFNFKFNAGYNTNDIEQRNIVYSKAFNPAGLGVEQPSIDIGTVKIAIFSTEAQLNHDVAIGSLKIQSLLGVSYSNQVAKSEAFRGLGFQSDDHVENLTLATTQSILGYTESEYRYAAGFARLNFNYAAKYLFNVTARRDGSSRFGDNSKFSNFYAVGAGWLFSKESFFNKLLPFVSHGKLRVSYGLTGNEQIPNYQYLESYSPLTGGSQNYLGVITTVPTRLVNPEYRWEKIQKYEGGLELGFLQDRFFVGLSYFYNRTSNQLLNYSLPITTGFTSVLANLPAVIVNKGLEIELNATPISNKDFTWKLAGNISFIRNRLAKFDDLANSSYAGTYVIGQPLSMLYRYTYNGVDPNSGLYSVQDLNADGSISSAFDMEKIVNRDPGYFGGISSSFKYKQVSLDFNFQFVGSRVTQSSWVNFSVPGSMYNQPQFVMKRWQKPGDNSEVQRFTTSATAFSRFGFSDVSYEDGSFIRLKNIAFEYNVFSKGKLKNKVSIFGQIQNLFTISRYSGLDPETGTGLPPLKTYIVGFRINY